jgi:sugar/nucleoside kinase (ribokinase family)
MENIDLAGIGALNLDLIYQVKDPDGLEIILDGLRPGGEFTLSPESEAELSKRLKNHATLLTKSGGGAASNAMRAASKLGLSCLMAGRVGADADGDYLLKELAGVDISLIKRGGASGRCLIILDPQGERTIFVSPGANDDLSISDIDETRLKTSKWIHLTSFAGEGPFLAQSRLMDFLPPETSVSFDPGELHARHLDHPASNKILARTALIFLNEAEAEILTGKSDEAAAGIILSQGPRIAVIKRGGAGCSIYTADNKFDIAAYQVQVVDSTGAGDVFAASFLAAVTRGLKLPECGKFASLAAARSISGQGRESYPGKALWDEFFALNR